MMLSEETSAVRPPKQTRFNGAKLVWMLKGSPLTVTGAVIIVLMLLMMIFSPWLATHDPNAIDLTARLLPPLIVQASLDIGSAILMAATLGFIGLGAQQPSAEWGAMVANGRNYVLDQWWYCAFPGAAILLTAVGFNLFGDGIRDLLDPKAGGKQS
ncbi:ABC transporter permease subunit [Escherichia coli]